MNFLDDRGYPNGDVLHGGCNYHVVIANRCYRVVGARRTARGRQAGEGRGRRG